MLEQEVIDALERWDYEWETNPSNLEGLKINHSNLQTFSIDTLVKMSMHTLKTLDLKAQ
jgi:hypothetical protein